MFGALTGIDADFSGRKNSQALGENGKVETFAFTVHVHRTISEMAWSPRAAARRRVRSEVFAGRAFTRRSSWISGHRQTLLMDLPNGKTQAPHPRFVHAGGISRSYAVARQTRPELGSDDSSWPRPMFSIRWPAQAE